MPCEKTFLYIHRSMSYYSSRWFLHNFEIKFVHLIFFGFICECSACMYICAPFACFVAMAIRRGGQIPTNQKYRSLWNVMTTSQSWSFARVTSALHIKAITPALKPLLVHEEEINVHWDKSESLQSLAATIFFFYQNQSIFYFHKKLCMTCYHPLDYVTKCCILC